MAKAKRTTVYLELPPDEIDPNPGLMQVQASAGEVERLRKMFNATVITKARAKELLLKQYQSEGFSEDDATLFALEDLGDIET